eukprot:TRINITY_DN7573_c0_g3_i1.p1 TRINITY_DN7573_c0_g3~~TRINITY_DN7573_c0_g3_i1.p1  ORF type:complete len:396 (+),score=68.01 TRINITY_DN7573_c0_g3_i1:82-1188(+)
MTQRGCDQDAVKTYVSRPQGAVSSPREVPERLHLSLLQAYAHEGDVQRAEAWHRKIVTASTELGNMVVLYNSLIHACSRGKRPDRAEYWFDQLKQQGLQPNEHTFGSMLNAFAETGDFDGADRYFNLMQDSDFSQENSVIYNTLIKACASKGNLRRAEELFQRMTAGGFQASVTTFNSMIHTCTMCGDIERAEFYVGNLEACGLQPNQVTMNSMMNAYCANGNVKEVERWLLKMTELGIQPTTVTFGTLCKLFARLGDPDAIRNIMNKIDRINASGTDVNEYFYASLITAYGNAVPPDSVGAERAFKEMVQRGLRPTSVKRALVGVLGERRTASLMEANGGKRGSRAGGGAANTGGGYVRRGRERQEH